MLNNTAAAVETATATATETAAPVATPVGAGWTEVTSPEVLERALRCARGCYQRDLLDGRESLSGSTLRGSATRYGDLYARSRRNLLRRVRAAGIPVSERRAAHGRRVLVIGA